MPTNYPIRPKLKPPNLRDRSQFVRLKRVPVIDVNSRKYRKGDQVIEETLDEGQLHRICHNSRHRAAKGEYGLLLLGHTTDGGKEIDQPPVVGYLDNYQVGEHDGRPTILADAYIYKDSDPSHVLRQFPRRSAEIIGLEEPDGYVDALSLIKRAPERDLGLITHYALNHDESRDFGAAIRYKSRKDVYRFSCPAGFDRFCPSAESEREPNMGLSAPRSGKMAKHLLHLLQQVVEGLLEETAQNDPDAMEPSDMEPSGMEPSGMEEEPSDFEEEDGEPSGMEPSGFEEEEDEEDEPSEMEPSRHRHHHHYAARDGGEKPSRHRYEASEPSEPSEPSDPSRMKSRRHKSRPKAVRLDPSTPSRHAVGAGGSGLGSGSAAGSGIGADAGGYPGPMTGTPKTTSRPKKDGMGIVPVKKHRIPGAKSRMRKEEEVSREESRPRTRMRRDSERTAVSRYQNEIDTLRSTVEQLQKESARSKHDARVSQIERQVIQLESEGIILDRQDEVDRLSQFASNKEVAREIKRMRTRYTRSPVGQPMLPNVWEDMGAGAQERELTSQQLAEMDMDGQGCEIVGSGIARFAADQTGLNGDKHELGRNAVSRFYDSRKPSRGRRPKTDEE
jgi:hypothetical protein